MTSTDLRALGRLGHATARSGGRRQRRLATRVRRGMPSASPRPRLTTRAAWGMPAVTSRRRLTTRAVRGVPAATPRRRLPRPLVALVAATLAAVGYLGVTAAEQGDGARTLAAIPSLPVPGGPASEGRLGDTTDRASRSSGVPASALGDEAAVPLADVDGLTVSLPHGDPVLVAFHEASLTEALELSPVGRLEANDNPTKFEGGRQADAPSYRVLASRGRPRPATSAVDVVVPKGATVTAPISGTVVEARQYALYGSTRDWRVVIESDERPDLQVVMIHLHQPAVEPGSEVVAGRTPVGVARQLPFTSQVDHVVGESLPHVHLEVKAATAAKPVDPNAPAVEPDAALDASSG